MLNQKIIIPQLNNGTDLDSISLKVKDVVNYTIEKRKRNARDTLTKQLLAGRLLTYLRPRFVYGEWYPWVDNNLKYSPNIDTNRSYAQRDIQLWRAFSSHIDKLIAMGAIYDIDNPEEEYVDILPDESVEIAGEIAGLLARDKVSEEARSFVLDIIQKHGEVPTKRQTSRLLETLDKVAELDAPEKEFAYALIHRHGLSNPDIVGYIPEIINNAEMKEELQLSGGLHVPGSGDNTGRSIPIENLSSTDIEIALGRYDIETELQTQSSTINSMTNGNGFAFITKVEGPVDTIRAALEDILKNYPDNQIIRLNIFSQYIDK